MSVCLLNVDPASPQFKAGAHLLREVRIENYKCVIAICGLLFPCAKALLPMQPPGHKKPDTRLTCIIRQLTRKVHWGIAVEGRFRASLVNMRVCTGCLPLTAEALQ